MPSVFFLHIYKRNNQNYIYFVCRIIFPDTLRVITGSRLYVYMPYNCANLNFQLNVVRLINML